MALKNQSDSCNFLYLVISTSNRFHSEPGRFQISGQFGINRPGSHGNFALQCNQPCDYRYNHKVDKITQILSTLGGMISVIFPFSKRYFFVMRLNPIS